MREGYVDISECWIGDGGSLGIEGFGGHIGDGGTQV